MEHIRIISAGAGSGKTHRLMSELSALLQSGQVRPAGIIATTFTRKAAGELQERVRSSLIEQGMSDKANALTSALIGTVHGLGTKLLQRFAYEAGVPPLLDIMPEDEQQVMFNESLATVLDEATVRRMNTLAERMGSEGGQKDWREDVRRLTELARANDFGADLLHESARRSADSLLQHFPDAEDGLAGEALNGALLEQLEQAIGRLGSNGDSTKKSATVLSKLKSYRSHLQLRGYLTWPEWAALGRLDVGKKSQDDVADLMAFAQRHEASPDFHADLRHYICEVFGIAEKAIAEYARYKKQRGLIDYTDMEALLKRLLQNPQVQATLREELDLLMVDEFQDTSPMQLDIFLRLSRLAKHSIWVGDPKQSIYGFRGAEPRLMLGLLQRIGIREADIQRHSWRSREEIVLACNAIFCKAFPQMEEAQIALQPKRTRRANPEDPRFGAEPPGLLPALWHWHFNAEDKRAGSTWLGQALAEQVHSLLARGDVMLLDKQQRTRPLRPGDIAILCRSNQQCANMAESLHRAGLQVSISRAGLLQSAEATLLMACLKYLLQQHDTLAIAEIMALVPRQSLADIANHRLAHVLDEQAAREAASPRPPAWGSDLAFVRQLDTLRPRIAELSGAEIVDLLLEELDLKRVVSAWGQAEQRLENLDELRHLALAYEEKCNQMHKAASLGGLLLWLSALAAQKTDMQGNAPDENAVNVLTYHKSKGLEWPLVICMQLEEPLRDRLWGLSIQSDREALDFDDLLGGRWLRYWAYPYGKTRLSPINERLEGSPEKLAAQQEAREEEARLLYVGLTRARDYLVFPTFSNRGSLWLNRVYHEGDENRPVLDQHSDDTPWAWKGVFLDKITEVLHPPGSFAERPVPSRPASYWPPYAGSQSFAPLFIDEAAQSPPIAYAIGDSFSYAQAYEWPEEDLRAAGSVLKAFFNADDPQAGEAERLSMAEGLLKRLLEDPAEGMAEALLRQSAAFQRHWRSGQRVRQIHRRYPLCLDWQGQQFRKQVDWLLDCEEGLVLVQHSSFAGQARTWKNKAQELGWLLALAAKAAEAQFGRPVLGAWVHFPLMAGLCAVRV